MHKILSHWLSDLDSFDWGWFVHYAKQKQKQHNNTTHKTKKQNKEIEKKDQVFILMRSFLSKKDIPVFYELTSIHRNSFVYFEK